VDDTTHSTHTTHTTHTPTITKEQILDMMIQAFNQTPYHQHIGLAFDIDEQENLNARFSKKAALLGNTARNMLHGGLISGVFDALGGVICSIELIEKYKNLDQKQGMRKLNRLCTVDLNLNYHSPAKAQNYIARGKVIHQGSSLFHIHMEMHDENLNLIASANANYMY
jgi:uncharacterized protein (TIGR00369 family)